MTSEIINLKSRREDEYAPSTTAPLNRMDFAPDFETPPGLLTHMRQLRRSGRVAARWLALAVVAGTITAAAFVNFFAR
ncbi:MAG: hypothetical protein ACRD4M_13250 [Candidatus Acidiferrales bacterium]